MCSVWMLRVLDKIPTGKWFLRKFYAVEDKSLEREVFGIHFRNPIGMAAGYDRNGEIYKPLSALGFVHSKEIQNREFSVYPRTRLFSTA